MRTHGKKTRSLLDARTHRAANRCERGRVTAGLRQAGSHFSTIAFELAHRIPQTSATRRNGSRLPGRAIRNPIQRIVTKTKYPLCIDGTQWGYYTIPTALGG